MLGLFAALLVLVLALAIASAAMLAKATMIQEAKTPQWRLFFTSIATSGYALPGSILAIGVMFCLSLMDQAYVRLGHWFGIDLEAVFLGSLTGLLIAYVVRYFRPGFGAVQASVDSIHQNHIESARLMGLTPWQRFYRVTLPLVLPGLLSGGLIVFVDVIKEMPATLLLRPFGWDTLAVKLYELTSEGEWQRAAIPALLLVLVSLIPVILLIVKSQPITRVGLVGKENV